MKNFSFEKPKDFGTLIAIKKENKNKNLTPAGGTNLDVYLKDRLYKEEVITEIAGFEKLKGVQVIDR